MVWAFAIQGQKLPFAVGLPDPDGICQIEEGKYCSALFIHVLDRVFNGADPSGFVFSLRPCCHQGGIHHAWTQWLVL